MFILTSLLAKLCIILAADWLFYDVLTVEWNYLIEIFIQKLFWLCDIVALFGK